MGWDWDWDGVMFEDGKYIFYTILCMKFKGSKYILKQLFVCEA